MSKKLRVAMLAPAWLPLPPKGYGGIEYVVHYLTIGLEKLGIEVELFTVGETTTPAKAKHYIYETGQYQYIHRSLYEAEYIPIAQVLYAMNEIKADGGFDIIHDHNGFTGPAIMALLDGALPPVVHTLHGPPFSTPELMKHSGLPDNRPMWEQIGRAAERLFLIPISAALAKDAPDALKPRILEPVHNSIDPADFQFSKDKHDYFITLARFSPDKGQALAARLCEELGYKLRMMGIVADLTSSRQVLRELANPGSPYHENQDFNYFVSSVLPYLDPGWIEYVGNLNGRRKLELIANAQALLFPIQWDEPFGLAVIEALASGTPVVAMRRGAMPEIIEHGKNGFLAKDEAEFKKYMQKVDQIDPADCRKSVEQRFSAEVMAKKYLARYQEAIRRCA